MGALVTNDVTGKGKPGEKFYILVIGDAEKRLHSRSADLDSVVSVPGVAIREADDLFSGISLYLILGSTGKGIAKTEVQG